MTQMGSGSDREADELVVGTGILVGRMFGIRDWDHHAMRTVQSDTVMDVIRASVLVGLKIVRFSVVASATGHGIHIGQRFLHVHFAFSPYISTHIATCTAVHYLLPRT